MKVRIDNVVVTVDVSGSGFYVLDEKLRRVSHHSFPSNIGSLYDDQSFKVNGHHYKTGNLVDEPCTCERCNPIPEDTNGS